MAEQTDRNLPSSFRDPSGFLFLRDGILYRQVNRSYREHYDRLMACGLYAALVEDGLLVPHEEIDVPAADPDAAYKIIRPERLSFISYPYEWCFSQLKDAALATLAIQKKAFDKGMVLKDASAYNIQFHGGRPLLLDTLSFETYRKGQPWIAYRQFCQHFLAPLALMCYRDVRLGRLARVHIDGVPLDLASRLLPFRTRLRPSLLTHIHLHGASQRRFADKAEKVEGRKVGKLGFLGVVDNIESAVRKLTWEPGGSEWADYYAATNYSDSAFDRKKEIVGEFLDAIRPAAVWDLGANDGTFSRLAAERGILTIAFDIDPAAVEKNYRQCARDKETRLLPLLLDLTNPSPAIGWANEERKSLLQRGPVDTVLALALVHHLAISNNVPLPRICAFLRGLCRRLVIEFVPKEDSQVQRLLATREDIFPHYTRQDFERAFGEGFHIRRAEPVGDTVRTLYWMESRGA